MSAAKLAGAMLLLGLLIFLFLSQRVTGGGWTMTQPQGDRVTWDLDGNAVRQAGFTVEDGDGNHTALDVTILGPTDRVVEPWLTIDAGFDGLRLVAIDGTATLIAPEISTVVFQDGAWMPALVEVPELDLPDLSDDPGARSLRDVIAERHPDLLPVLDRAFPERRTP